jgi:hypothetical protein
MATIKRGEMKKLVDSFQKDKKLGLDGWLIEYYLELYKIL